MEKYYGNYLGLVVNDQDPEGRDRVQIYVPGVTNTIYDNWNNNNTNKSIGMDIGSTFTLNEEILKKLRSVLPWAEKATPLIGPGTAMYHQEGIGADSAVIYDENWVEVPVDLPSVGATGGNAEVEEKVNDDGLTSITIEPYVGDVTDIPDKPTDIVGEGMPQGTRSSTKILSRVWLFFYGGDIQTPVFFAYSLPPNETYAHNNVKIDNNLNQDNLNPQLPDEQLPDEQLPDEQLPDENLTDNQIEAREWLDKIITEKVDDSLYGNKSTFTQDTKDPYVFRDDTTGLVYSVNYLNGNYSSSLLSKSVIINDPKPNDRDYIAPYESPNNNKTFNVPIPSDFFN